MAQSDTNKHELQDPSFIFDDALYCQEENWEEEEDEILNGDGSFFDETNLYSCSNNNNRYYPVAAGSAISKLNPQKKLNFSEQDLYWENDELSNLLSKEERNLLDKSLKKDPYLATARFEAVEWMLRVHGYYSFGVLTAVLAVNYLDRFLFSFQFQREKPWMTQLTAVACLSLAAKVEETRVPLLLDLQVEDTKFIFEAKTIQRMEILVLSTLQWKMNPVSPHSFLDYITRRLGLKDNLCREFLRRCERLLLSSLSDSRFIGYLPSELAAAIMLHVIHNVEPCIGEEYQDQLLGILGIDRDTVDECSHLIHELATGVNNNILHSNKRKSVSLPGSPNGVIDVSFSSDSSNDSWAVAAPSSVSSSPERPMKRVREVNQSPQFGGVRGGV